MAPLVRLLLLLFFPISYPISKVDEWKDYTKLYMFVNCVWFKLVSVLWKIDLLFFLMFKLSMLFSSLKLMLWY